MGGYSTILEGAYIGLSAVLHQFTIIGAFAMIGMASVITRNVPPLGLAVGSPARVIKINQKALEKAGLNEFEWVNDYLKLPALSNIHPKLQIYFQNYLDITSSSSEVRKAVTIYRENFS
jgi:acyl-[acyl carrier protein]--UDP-N-acetylglucosamine O-acyltransferase